MATLTFVYDKRTMNPAQLGDQIATSLSLATNPTVDINPTQIIVTHPNVTSANTAAIQTLINAYVFDPVWAGGALTALQAKAVTALAGNGTFLGLTNPTAANNTYIALASPTTAQNTAQIKALTQQANATVAQLVAITKQINALIRLDANQLDSTSGT